MFFKKKEKELDKHQIVSSLLSYIINDKKLSYPLYLHEITCEEDAENLGLYPIVYVWNENREAGSFSISINGKAVGHLLEAVVPREHSQFNTIRDETMLALSKAANESVVSTCEAAGLYPSDLFCA